MKGNVSVRSETESVLISAEAYEKVMYRLKHPRKPTKRLVKAMGDYSKAQKHGE